MRLLLCSAARRAPLVTFRSLRHFQHARNDTTPNGLKANGPARTRFAPSPTGYLHLGSLRTALFNYLVAKATGGQFILRLEDTDQKRTVPDAEQRLYEDLEWTGIEFDEGPTKGGPYGSYKQSERTEIYRKHTGLLLASGNAYRCFCTAERLHTLANHRSKLGLPPDYDRTCAHISKEESDDRASQGESHVVRLKVPEKYPVFEDLVYGIVRQRKDPRAEKMKQASFDDPILLKTDGFPTYHLANVVDDHLMKITHVIRGSEWMSSTPKHLAMYHAFGWEPPSFAHVGLLVDGNRQKLSKRTGSIDISSYRQQGIFSETLTNFVALLGWSHYEKSDVMAMEDLIRNFSLKFTKGDSIVSFEKLFFLQRRHAKRYSLLPPSTSSPPPLEELALRPLLAELSTTSNLPTYSELPSDGTSKEDYARSVLLADVGNYITPAPFIQRNISFFRPPTKEELRAASHDFSTQSSPSISISAKELSTMILPKISEITQENWNASTIKSKINEVVLAQSTTQLRELEEGQGNGLDVQLAFKKAWGKIVMGYLRWALVGGLPGPDTSETVRILGRMEVSRRLDGAERFLDEEEKGGS